MIDNQLSHAVAALRSQEVSAETVRVAADEVSELIRYVNHATSPWSAPAALPSPADTTRLIGALHEVAQHLHQTLGQAGERIAAVGHDSEEAHDAVRHLETARETLREVTRHLSQAHGAAAQLSR
jgi:small-conductance mechanosensitive channel